MPQDYATGDFEPRDTPQHFLFDINDVLSYSVDEQRFYYYRLRDNNQEKKFKFVFLWKESLMYKVGWATYAIGHKGLMYLQGVPIDAGRTVQDAAERQVYV